MKRPMSLTQTLTVCACALLLTWPASAQSDSGNREDPLNFDNEFYGPQNNTGKAPYIPDDWREPERPPANWQDELNKPFDPNEDFGGDLDAELMAPPRPAPASFSQWYHNLDQADKQRVISFMAEKVLTNDDGSAFSERDMEDFLPIFDRALRQEAKTEEERAAAFRQIEQDTGIMPGLGAEFEDFGTTGSTGPRSAYDTGR